ANAERIDRVPGVRRQLDSGSDLAELVRLLEDEHAKALDCQTKRRGQPADAAASNHDRDRVARSSQRCVRDDSLRTARQLQLAPRAPEIATLHDTSCISYRCRTGTGR